MDSGGATVHGSPAARGGAGGPEPPVTGYGTLAAVWLCLLGLTAVLVGASLASPALAVAAMLVVTPLKAALVFYVFMDLRHEAAPIKLMLAVALAALVVFIGMTFLDVAFR